MLLKSGWLICDWSDLRSKISVLEVFGEKVFPKFLSPPGDRGGVCICELFGEWGAAIFDKKIGDGGAVSEDDGYGLPISLISMLTSLSVVPIASHFMNS